MSGPTSDDLISSLLIIDPILQFLTKATGNPLIPFKTLIATLPATAKSNTSCNTNDTSPTQTSGKTNVKLSPDSLLLFVKELSKRNVLHLKESCSQDNTNKVQGNNGDQTQLFVGFPLPPSIVEEEILNQDKDTCEKRKKHKSTSASVHGSTKASAKRRLTALRKSIKLDSVIDWETKREEQNHADKVDGITPTLDDDRAKCNSQKDQKKVAILDDQINEISEVPINTQPKETTPFAHDKNPSANEALSLLHELFNIKEQNKKLNISKNNGDSATTAPFSILPNQAAYAGCQPARPIRYGALSQEAIDLIPADIGDAFSLKLNNDDDEEQSDRNTSSLRRHLFYHQSEAINSVLSNPPLHTIVCTGTGSGKSMCFLLPVLSSAMTSNSTSILIFPTKALAQDQFTKLISLLNSSSSSKNMKKYIRPGVIDGDTSHSDRLNVSESCNIILTNPDTLHAAILPGWKGLYRKLLSNLRYVVLDEAHIYEGIFGCHVSLVLSRLFRICAIASEPSDCNESNPEFSDLKEDSMCTPTFIACSATLLNPELHFRSLCPIGENTRIRVLGPEDDGSPCAPKHFFVWNPTLLDQNGNSSGTVVAKFGGKKGNETSVLTFPRQSKKRRRYSPNTMQDRKDYTIESNDTAMPFILSSDGKNKPTLQEVKGYNRRHPAEETAILLAHAVKNRVRCIAFCKTRSLVEWVYDRCIVHLRLHPDTEDLALKVESYRGGYSADVRRSIERKLFQNELLGVVGTSALELGVDIGGIDLTLHCGYPGSLPSLLQQSGRAGRGGSNRASFSIVVCFSSPAEQHMWKKPSGILCKKLSNKTGKDAVSSISVNPGALRGHLLCASSEFPLTGKYSVRLVMGNANKSDVSDHDLFGSIHSYQDAIQTLFAKGMIRKENISVSIGDSLVAFSLHPAVKKPFSLVSMRSIEPLSYAIVDVSHPRQGGRKDRIHHEEAVLDTIPYSRVFYHVFPGAIIRHRGRKYKVTTMASPPAVLESFGMWNGSKLAAFAEPTVVRYFTQALALTQITVVKRFEFADYSIDQNNSRTSEIVQIQKQNNEVTAQKNHEHKNGIDENSRTRDESTKSVSINSVAGNGVVNIKRTVHGYAKLSPITRAEISRTEIRMPPMEYDTNALWLDSDASTLVGSLFEQDEYDNGVHALSHAMLAVAPCFVPGCTSSDLDCDHGYNNCTRVMIFDSRAGGAGLCAQLWKYVFCDDGILQAALDILEECPTCNSPISNGTNLSKTRDRYDGGCPSCIQSGPCMNFNQGLSRRAGLLIGRHMLKRIQQTSLYQKNILFLNENSSESNNERSTTKLSTTTKQEEIKISTPKEKRSKKFQDAFDLVSAKKRHVVVGRPSWPTDQSHDGNANDDNEGQYDIGNPHSTYIGDNKSVMEAGGGFMID